MLHKLCSKNDICDICLLLMDLFFTWMLKGLHGILINIQGGNVGTVETPFIGYYVLYTVQS